MHMDYHLCLFDGHGRYSDGPLKDQQAQQADQRMTMIACQWKVCHNVCGSGMDTFSSDTHMFYLTFQVEQLISLTYQNT